jgi:hypothetical protein
MSSCIAGREVVLKFRERKGGRIHIASVVCPAKWTRGRLLTSCRKEHPGETVVIREWKTISSENDRWSVRLWIVNPREMA